MQPIGVLCLVGAVQAIVPGMWMDVLMIVPRQKLVGWIPGVVAAKFGADEGEAEEGDPRGGGEFVSVVLYPDGFEGAPRHTQVIEANALRHHVVHRKAVCC